MTKETKFYLWLGLGIAAAAAVAWWYMKKGPGAPAGAKLTP